MVNGEHLPVEDPDQTQTRKKQSSNVQFSLIFAADRSEITLVVESEMVLQASSSRTATNTRITKDTRVK